MKFLFLSILLSSCAFSSETFVYGINGTATDKFQVKNAFVDLFDSSTDRIKNLKKQGKTVICYFSAGSSESWRPDFKQFPKAAIGKPLIGWAGENWLDYRNKDVLSVLKKRIELAKSKGCNSIDPDNIDTHLNKSGFGLTAKDQFNFIAFLSTTAHGLGLKIGLKNSAETASSLQPLVDFVVVEECAKYKECNSYASFPKNKKNMFQIEYQSVSKDICKSASSMGASVIFSNKALTDIKFCP